MPQKKPCKPKPTSASTPRLVSHYNSSFEAYNRALLAMDEKKRPETGFQGPIVSMGGLSYELDNRPIDRDEVIELIRRQNLRLSRHIKTRAHELLLLHTTDPETGEKVLKDGKYSVGLTYQAILDILSEEFPECSTSAAALRWYVVHMRSDADDEGLPWPPLPQVRPRSSAAPKAAD